MITVTSTGIATNLPRQNSGNHLSAPKCPASGPWISKRTDISGEAQVGAFYGPHLSTEQVKKIKTNPESFDGQSIRDYLANTAGIPGRDTSKLNLEIHLSTLTAVPIPGVCARLSVQVVE